MKGIKLILISMVFIFVFLSLNVFAQEIQIKSEFRPRLELRNGYRMLRSVDTQPAYFVSQRSRLNINYAASTYKLFTSIQDVRVWGDKDPRNISGTMNMFEFWAQFELNKNFDIKIGRQTFIFDNERLLSQNNWRQAGRSHDGLLLKYKNENFNSGFGFSFNQSQENVFGTDYTIQNQENYKLLTFLHNNVNLSDNFSFSVLNITDGFQSDSNSNVMYLRATSGGIMKFDYGNLSTTFSAYYQYGKSQKGKSINAHYLNPEVSFKAGDFKATAGLELLSGQDSANLTDISYFVPLYGSNHRFNGFMDYFTRFPEDLRAAGLLNPYLYIEKSFGDMISVSINNHLFYTNKNYIHQGSPIAKYLGFETDLVLNLKFDKDLSFEFGMSTLFPSGNLSIIKGGDSSLQPYWIYSMLKFSPTLLSIKL